MDHCFFAPYELDMSLFRLCGFFIPVSPACVGGEDALLN
jgi:hypothetical protein